MPCEEYILQDEYDYFFNSLAGDFAAGGEWKNQDAEEWKNGCVADLRQRPPQVTRAHSLPHLGCLAYSAENGLYAASRAAGSGDYWAGITEARIRLPSTGSSRPPLDMTVRPGPCAGLTIPSGWAIPPTPHGLNSPTGAPVRM